jgi:hypothetical protein
MTFPPCSLRWDRILERINATHPPCCIAMNSVDIAAFIANDDAEYLGDLATIALNGRHGGHAARGRAQQAQPSFSRRLPARAQTKTRPWHERGRKLFTLRGPLRRLARSQVLHQRSPLLPLSGSRNASARALIRCTAGSAARGLPRSTAAPPNLFRDVIDQNLSTWQ